MRSLSQVIGLLSLVVLLVGGGKLTAADAELKKLHVLMVFDTSDAGLASSLTIDEWRMYYFLASNIPPDRYKVTVLKEEEVTPERILAYYRDLKVTANDGLLFFYGGHGATDPDKGQYFKLACGKNVIRSELRKAMQKKNAGLTVLLSDCCSTPLAIKKKKESQTLPKKLSELPVSDELKPVVRCLLFQSRGTVDVTAATNNASWSDNEKGGLFTRAFCMMLTRSVKSLDLDHNGIVTWKEFFPQLQRETEAVFRSWSRELMARGEEISETAQKPQSFTLGKMTAAVVGIENGTKDDLVYYWRWEEKGPWHEVKLAPGKRMAHSIEVPASAETLPRLQVWVKGQTKTVKAKKWQGEGEPPLDKSNTHPIKLAKK